MSNHIHKGQKEIQKFEGGTWEPLGLQRNFGLAAHAL
jgi:hypothetical protein